MTIEELLNPNNILKPPRKWLEEEELKLAGSMSRLTKAEMKRWNQVCSMLRLCICRKCKKQYDESKSRGDYKGFCSAKCQHTMAKELGYRKNGERSEFSTLQRHNEVGSVFVYT